MDEGALSAERESATGPAPAVIVPIGAAWQHVVIAAFVYSLAIKVMLAKSGRYVLDSDEEVTCETLDALLDSDWGRGCSACRSGHP
jgi:hypothetical protein